MKVSKKILALAIIFLFSGYFCSSNENSFENPRKSYKYFVENSLNRNFSEAAKCLNLKEIQDNIRPKDLAKKLFRVMKVKLLILNFKNIPDNPNYLDSNSFENEYILSKSPYVSLELVQDKWLFSLKTVKNIEKYYSEYYPFTLNEFVIYLPDYFTTQKIFNIYLWQILFFIIQLLIAFIIYLIFKWIINVVIKKIIKKLKKLKISEKLIYNLARPLSYIIIVFFIILTLPLLDLPYNVYSFLARIFIAFIPAFSMVIGYQFVDILSDFLAKKAEKTKTTVDDHLVPFARKLMKIIVIVFGLVYILQIFGISIAPLLAGISIGGLAFALAAQDTVKNLFGSITIFTDQPFKIGDWIVFDGVEGTVEEVGIRSTRIRTFYDSLITVPNGKLADLKIDNMGERQYRRYYTKLIMTYDSDVVKLEEFVERIKDIVNNHPKTRKDYYQIHINEFGEKGIEIMFYIFFEVPDWTEELKSRHQVILRILKIAQELNLRFAYPLRDYSKDLPPQN